MPFFDVRKNEQMLGVHTQRFVNVHDAANGQQDGGFGCCYSRGGICLQPYYHFSYPVLRIYSLDHSFRAECYVYFLCIKFSLIEF